MKKLLLFTVLAFISICSCYSQVETKPLRVGELTEQGKFKAKQKPKKTLFSSPDITKFLEEDKKEAEKQKPLRFGAKTNVNIGLEDGIWEQIETGRVWRLNIVSEKALSLNLNFDEFFLPTGAELYLYDSDRTMIYGPVTSAQNNKDKILGTPLIKGNSLIIELFEPSDVKGQSKVHINKLVHGYRDIFEQVGGFGQSASCHNDVVCPIGNGWENESDAVALVIINNDRVASGTLVNNGDQNYVPYFLSAYHAFNYNKQDPTLDANEILSLQSSVFLFKYKKSICNGNDDPIPTSLAISGAYFKSGWSGTDFILLQLNQQPSATSGIKYAGWTINTSATSTVGIHHPMGDVMKITVDNHPPYDYNNEKHTVFWDSGLTEDGSSGSALFNQDHKIIGVLKGGSSSCTDSYTEYFKLSRSWTGDGTPQTRLKDLLGGYACVSFPKNRTV